MLLLLASLAQAGTADPVSLTWDLSINNKAVGTRTLTMRTDESQLGELRTLQAYTEVDASVFGISFAYKQRLTANADIGPASFISVIDQGGTISQVQGRKAALGWIMTVATAGRSRTYDIATGDVDLSTADLLDPQSRVPLSRFERARVLSAETGEVLEGPVEPLGPSEIRIDGQDVPVEGYTWTTDQGAGTFWYTSEGWLVRFESRILGQRLSGTLSDPPPAGQDDAPVDLFGPGLQATEL